MLLDQETLKIIFGLKLRQHRQAKELSLKELSNISGLSTSYINEIEKGKKYPKNDKIMLLAQSLGVAYDDLISVKLNKELKHLTNLLETNLLQNIPLDLFGIPAQGLLELIASEPEKFKILVGTLVELARSFNLRVKDFLFASLRAYVELRNNYFEEIEIKVQEFCEKHNWLPQNAYNDIALLRELLIEKYNYEIVEIDFFAYKGLHDLKQMIVPLSRKGGGNIKFRILLNKNLSFREKSFIYAKEIGHHFLDQGERSNTSIWLNLDSYEQLKNNFTSSYFASALFIPKDDLIIKLRSFFQNTKWNASDFLNIITSYHSTWDSVFHRMTQILPNFFNLDQIFFLRFGLDTTTDVYDIISELHLSELHTPHGVRSLEHYCRRWFPIILLKKSNHLIENDLEKDVPIVAVQRALFFQTENEYLCFTMVKRESHSPQTKTSLTIGLLVTPSLREKVLFLNDPEIPATEVNITCERCGIIDCNVRAAPHTLYDNELKLRQTNQSIEELFNTYS